MPSSQRPKALTCEGIGVTPKDFWSTPKELTTSLNRGKEPTHGIARNGRPGATSSTGFHHGRFMLANLFAALAADHAALWPPACSPFSAMPAARACSLTGPSPAVWLQPVNDHRRAHPADRGWCGPRCAGERRGRGWRCSRCSASSPGCRACRLPLTERMIWPRLNVWSTHSSSLLARLL